MTARRRSAPILLAALAALVLSACELRLTADVVVDADGAGSVTLEVLLDEELATSLAADGFDPFAGLDELPDGWTSQRHDGDPPRGIVVRATFADPTGLDGRVQQLRDGLDADDPVLIEALTVTPDGEGGASLSGSVGLQPPSSTGVEGGGITFDGDALQALLRERGDEVLQADLRVALPGRVVEHDGDRVEGSTVVWELPVGSTRTVSAVSEPAPSRVPYLVAAGVVVGVTALAFVATARRRRR